MENSIQNQTFQTTLAWLFDAERGLSEHPSDPGGITKYGISLRYLKQIKRDINHDGLINRDDILALTKPITSELYYHGFWKKVKADQLPSPIAIALCDGAVNQGKRSSVKCLQRALNIYVDGLIGPKTIGAAQSTTDHFSLLADFLARRAHYYHKITRKNPDFEDFILGWNNRLFDLNLYIMENTHA